jgi:hypothetical protein
MKLLDYVVSCGMTEIRTVTTLTAKRGQIEATRRG